MPSRPRISPVIWKPVTWSRPSSSQHVGLERAGADGVDRLEGVAGAVQVLLALDLAAAADQLVEPVEFVGSRPKGRHSSTQVALRTGVLSPFTVIGGIALICTIIA
jgi:hypothetical protein